MTPIAGDVLKIMLDHEYWVVLCQLIRIIKPLVDAIGNLETCKATLVDCTLKIICCMCNMSCLSLDPDDNVGFWSHAKLMFNREFHALNTSLHSLSLFLHPLCHKLAISQTANGHSFEFTCKTALNMA